MSARLSRWSGALAVLVTLAAPAARGDEPTAPSGSDQGDDKDVFQLGGRIFSYVRVPLDPDAFGEPLQQVSTSLWLEGSAHFTDALSAKVVLTGDVLTPSVDDKLTLHDKWVREAWASAHGKGLELRVGQQIISWGNADGINFLDLLTATDFRFFSADPEVRKFGAPSVYASWVPGEDGPVELALVWTPLYPQADLLLPKNLLPSGVTLNAPERQPLTIQNTEAAAKLTYTGQGFDIAAVGFYGFNHLPEFYLAHEDPTGITIGQTNYHYAAVGGQGSFTLDKWVFRLESAYTFTENNRGAIAFIQPSFFGAILGVERPLGERFRVNAQGFVRYHPYWNDPLSRVGPNPAIQAVAAANATMQNYTDQTRPGASLRIAYTSEDERVEAEIFALGYTIGEDYMIRPLVAYHVTDAFKLQLGAEYFGGPTSKSLGALHVYSGAFFQAGYTF